jgi:hypothetical protein
MSLLLSCDVVVSCRSKDDKEQHRLFGGGDVTQFRSDDDRRRHRSFVVGSHVAVSDVAPGFKIRQGGEGGGVWCVPSNLQAVPSFSCIVVIPSLGGQSFC